MTVISLSRIIAHWVAQQPDRPAILHDAQSISWAELEQSTNRLARAYADLGVKADDFVTVALPNSIEFFESCFAIWKLGATPQPVSAKLPKFERDQIIELCSPSLVVGVNADDHPGFTGVPIGFTPDATLSGDEIDERVATSFKAMTSGGSTGRPKLIVSATPAVWDPEIEWLNFPVQGSVLVPGPLYHNGPFLWAMIPMFKGCTVTITTRFDAEESLRLIDQNKINTVYFVPTMMQRIWTLPSEIRTKYDVTSLRTLWHLAAPCPAWLKEEFINWLGPEVIWELYGGTEGTGTTTIRGDDWLTHKGSVGKPVETCEIIIIGEDGETLPPGEIGEVFLRPLTGPASTYRYIGAEAKAIDGGFESLGDLGYMDEDGYLYLTDRLTDMILSGGANIYPAEVEAAIDAFPGVRSSAVIGLPHDELGNAVHAIVDAPAGDVTEENLLAHLSDRLVRYKVPRTVEFADEPLRDDAGKVRRKSLRADRVAQ
jgi:bile acid-coenzyme A ligase